jgi:anaerobic selenocysteine-containing dehydrogenase
MIDADAVLEELDSVARERPGHRSAAPSPLHLIARRMRDVNGSIGRQTPDIRRRNPFNPLHMHPQDMAPMNLGAHDAVRISSADGSIAAVVRPDNTLREGVVSMSHNWGSLTNDETDYETQGASTNLLIRTTRNFESLNAMSRMTGIPVRVSARADVPVLD